jgi:hypothetical protein
MNAGLTIHTARLLTASIRRDIRRSLKPFKTNESWAIENARKRLWEAHGRCVLLVEILQELKSVGGVETGTPHPQG